MRFYYKYLALYYEKSHNFVSPTKNMGLDVCDQELEDNYRATMPSAVQYRDFRPLGEIHKPSSVEVF